MASKKMDALCEGFWRKINEERNYRIEAFLDTLSMADREIVKAVIGLREYEFMKRPTISKAAKLLGMPVRTLHRKLKAIVKSVPSPKEKLFPDL